MTIQQTDHLVLEAALHAYGAIDDCEATEQTVVYFFESGHVGTVDRETGTVTFADGGARA